MFFGIPLATILEGSKLLAALAILAGMVTVFIKGVPERFRAKTEREAQDDKAAKIIRDEYALRYSEMRLEVHALRNELQVVRGELAASQAKSMRRGDKLNMVLFILRMVMDELQSKDPGNKVLKQANILLHRVENESPDLNASPAVQAAEHTVEVAKEAVVEVKAAEAKK